MADNPRRGGRDRGGYGGHAQRETIATEPAPPRLVETDATAREIAGTETEAVTVGEGTIANTNNAATEAMTEDTGDAIAIATETLTDVGGTTETSPDRDTAMKTLFSQAKKGAGVKHSADLPTRSKQQSDRGSNTPLSFRVGKGDESSRASQGRDIGKASEERRHSPQHENDIPMGDDHREEDEDDVDVEADMDMAAMMGFGGFGTTKNTHVKGNNAGGVRKEKKTEYRQYMNRIGGFNRPLSPGHQ
ncbi:hypothetical protein PG995_013495 [Apiospora arundinis]